MSTYLYPEYHEDKAPYSTSSTTSRFLLRLISKWCTPDLWDTDPDDDEVAPVESIGFYSNADARWREGMYHQHAFVLAKEKLPATLDEFVLWAKDNWEPHALLTLGQEIGRGDITRGTYLDAMAVLEKIVKDETHVIAI